MQIDPEGGNATVHEVVEREALDSVAKYPHIGGENESPIQSETSYHDARRGTTTRESLSPMVYMRESLHNIQKEAGGKHSLNTVWLLALAMAG